MGFFWLIHKLVTWSHQAYRFSHFTPSVLEVGHKLLQWWYGTREENQGKCCSWIQPLSCLSHREAWEKEELTCRKDDTLKHLFLRWFPAFCCSSHLSALRFTVMLQKHPGGKSVVIYVPERSVSCVHTTHITLAELGWCFSWWISTWLLRWCCCGWCLILDIIQNIKMMLGLCQCAAWLSLHLTKKENVPGKPGLTPLSHALTCYALDLSPAAVIPCMRSPSREDFGTWVAMPERLAGPDVKAPWRPKMETEKNGPCSSKGTCPHDTRLNPRQCLLKNQTSNSRSSLPAVTALQEKHLFSIL